MVTRKEGFRGWVKTVKEVTSTNWELQNSQWGGVKYSVGNMVNNVVITMYEVDTGNIEGALRSLPTLLGKV